MFALRNKAKYGEISCKSGLNVYEIFTNIVFDSSQYSADATQTFLLSIENNKNTIKKIGEQKDMKKYEFDYSIILLEDKEEGLMEDFLKEIPIESDISDFYNYNLDEKKFQKLLKDSILYHYENHLKEEMEKRRFSNIYDII